MTHRTRLASLILCGAAIFAGCDSSAATESATELGDGYGGTDAAQHAPLDIPAGSPTVLFLGDSLSAGLHLPAEDAFPAAAQRLLHERGHPFHLVNAGVSGDTTAGGLSRAAYVLEHAKPDVVVIELGANDALRGFQLASTEANLRAIIERVRGAGATPLLLGMNAPTNLGEYAEDFAALYGRIAEDMDVAILPRFLEGVGGVPRMNLEDGMHPTPAGHERLASNIAPALEEVLEAALAQR